MITIEVQPDGGAWRVVEIKNVGDAIQTSVLTHRRRKSSAMLLGTGAAMVLKCELKVKNRKGEYTTEGSSFGNDPRRIKG